MYFRFWLASLRAELKRPLSFSRMNRRRIKKETRPALIEVMEPRRLLSAVPVGTETQVNTTTTDDQTKAAVARDAVGGYVAVWQSSNQDGSPNSIFGQRYNGDGVALGSEFQINAYTTGAETNPAVAIDQKGDFVVVWQGNGPGGDDHGIYAQRFNASGIAQGSEFLVNTVTGGNQVNPAVSMDARGDFVITWENGGPPGPNTIEAQRYSSTGVAQGSEFTVNTSTNGDQTNPSIAENASGTFVITWSSAGAGQTGQGIFATLYNSSGTPVSSQIQVNTTTTTNESSPNVAIDGAGDFVVTWTSDKQDGDKKGVFAQRFDNTGAKAGSEFQVNTYTTGDQFNSVVSSDRKGNFVIAWTSNNQDGDGQGIFAQRFNASGVKQGSEFRVETTSANDQKLPAIASDPMGDFVILWSSAQQDGDGLGIFAQRYQADIAPLLYNMESSTLHAVATQDTQITSNLLAVDQDSQVWSGATVKISGNYQFNEDQLLFAPVGNIHGSWNASTGTLTLSGVDTVTNYRIALRNVLYHDSSSTPNTSLIRTVSFQANDGVLRSNVVTRDIQVEASSPPVLSNVGPTLHYIENEAPIFVADGLIISNSLGGTLASATVTFTNWQRGDRTRYNNLFALQHTFTEDLSNHTATLTITGNASIDHYQAMLRSVEFWNVSDNPSTAIRHATFMVNDGGVDSNSVTRDITVTRVNDAPIIAGISSTAVSYKANDPAYPPQLIAPTIHITDPDNATLSKATVRISGNYQNNSGGHDILSFVNQNGITGSFNASTGTLTLTGVATVADYNEALRSVKFSTSGSATSTATRTITVTATDTASSPATSAAATISVTVSITNEPPALTGIPSSANYVRGSAAIKLAPNALILDNDSINMAGATIRISGNFHSATDVLSFTSQFGISGSFNSSTGTLRLSGIASIADYEAVLRSVTFRTTSSVASRQTRTIMFSVFDGLASSSQTVETVSVS